MEKNMNADVTNTAPQDSQTEARPAESTEHNTEDTTPLNETESEADGQSTENQDGGDVLETSEHTETPETIVPVQYNHEYKELTVPEATAWAQKGMAAEAQMEKLRYLAAAQGADSVNGLIKMLVEGHEELLRSQFREKVNDETIVEQLIGLEREKYQGQAKTMAENETKAENESQEQISRRLANEFGNLHELYPELKSFDDIPDSVLAASVSGKQTLTESYLRYQLMESRKKTAAEEAAKAAKTASAGSMNSDTSEQTDAAINAALKGVFG